MGKKENKKNGLTKPKFRAPVVTIMGHVDHGKTTLLDYIRNTNVAEKEFGGITQHVRVYQVEFEGKPITFIDTPGHEAFFAMRERGARITDIIVLVVAADDGVMPQTKEVIDLWRKTNTQLIVAINKIDVVGANVDKVKRELVSEGVLLEGFGGQIPIVEISAKHGTNVEKLLELINLVAELNQMDKYTEKGEIDYESESIVLESFMDKNVGPVATVIVKLGEMRQGEYIVGGNIYGKIRALFSDNNHSIKEAWESLPVRVVGIPKVLKVGEITRTYSNESAAKNASKEVSFNEQREKSIEKFSKSALAAIFASQEQNKELKRLNIIIVADAEGSSEAILNALKKINVPGVELNILESRTGTVTQSDVEMAKIKSSIILTFNTKVDVKIIRHAEESGVLIREYKIIYELLEEVEAAMISLVAPTDEEEIIGEAEIRQVFVLSNKKYVAGCRVSKGKIVKGYNAYILRKGEKVHEGKIISLKHVKDEIKESTVGTECGVLLNPNIELQVGDVLVCLKLVKSGY